MHYQVDYWYRHESDPDQSIRDIPQMFAGAPNGEGDILQTIASLRAQGYTVQRVELRAVCARCDGSGRVGKRPKGARRDRPYRPVYVDCAVCDGGKKEYPRIKWPLEASTAVYAALERLTHRVEQIVLPDGSTPDTLEARAVLNGGAL